MSGVRGYKDAEWLAASMLTAAYPLRKDGTLDQDLCASYLDNRDKGKQALRTGSRTQDSQSKSRLWLLNGGFVSL